MSRYIRMFPVNTARIAVAVSVFTLAACGEKTDDAQAAQRDLAIAPPSTPAVPPPVSDVPVTPPSKSTPTRVTPPRTKAPPVTTPVTPPTTNPPVSPPASPAPSYGTIASGAEFAVRPATKVCTNTQKVGDRITAVVSEAVSGSGGVSIPAGATATLEVTKAQFGNNDATKVALDFRVVSVVVDGRTYDVEGNDVTPAEVTKVRRQSTGDQAKKVAIGAAAGAVVGRVLGGSTKSTVVGGAIGALGGAATAAGTADYDGCVAADSRMAVKLTQDLRIRVS